MQYKVEMVDGDVLTLWDGVSRQKWGSKIFMELTVPGHEFEAGDYAYLTIKKVERIKDEQPQEVG